ncbi:MAG: hypothetical protein ACLTG4_07095 [Oscillospiraceae bacterium]
MLGSHIGHTYTFEPDGQTLLEGVARDYLLWLLRRELTPPDSMLDFFRSDTPLTDRILGDQRSGLTDCALAGVECVLEAYTHRAGDLRPKTPAAGAGHASGGGRGHPGTRARARAGASCWAASISSRSWPRSRRAYDVRTSSSPRSRSICVNRRPDG